MSRTFACFAALSVVVVVLVGLVTIGRFSPWLASGLILLWLWGLIALALACRDDSRTMRGLR